MSDDDVTIRWDLKRITTCNMFLETASIWACSCHSALPLSRGLRLQWQQPSAQVSSPWKKRSNPIICVSLTWRGCASWNKFSELTLTWSCFSAVQQFVSGALADTVPSSSERPSCLLLCLHDNREPWTYKCCQLWCWKRTLSDKLHQ